MIKRIFSMFLVISIFFYSLILSFVPVYADTSNLVLNLTEKVDVFNQIGNKLNTSIPTSFVNGYAVNYAMDIETEIDKLARQEYENLSDTQKQEYNNSYSSYYVKNHLRLYSTASNTVAKKNNKLSSTFEYFSSKYSEFQNKVYTSVGEMLNQGSIAIDDLNKKVRLQVDTSLVNRALDYNLDNDISLKTKYDTYSSIPIMDKLEIADVDTMNYANLYFSMTSEKDRADLLFSISKYLPIDDMKKPISCLVLPTNLPILIDEEFINFDADLPMYWDSSKYEYSDIFDFAKRKYKVPKWTRYGMHLSDIYRDYGKTSSFFIYPILERYNFRNDYKTVSEIDGNAASFFNNAFTYADFYFVSNLGAVIKKDKEFINENANLGTPPVPVSLVSNTIQLPFATHEDVSNFRQKYLLYSYSMLNRPVNYVITLGDLLSGKLDNAQPATMELVADLPVVNTTDFPVSTDFPTSEDVEKEKQKDKTKEKEGISVGFDLTKLKETIQEALTSLFVPSDTFFQDEINKMKTALETKIDLKYIDKIFGGFKNVGVYTFEDIYITLDGNHVKVFDFSFVRNNLTTIKSFTDPLFWLLLMLFVFNETHFLIRGSYPLTLNRGDDEEQ